MASDMESTLISVLLLFLPRFAQAIFGINAPVLPFLSFLLLRTPSVYRSASIGDIFAAILRGFLQDKYTVIREKREAPTKIRGSMELTITIPSILTAVTRVITIPRKYPAAAPTGIPIAASTTACSRMIRLICRPVVPIVLSRP